MNATAPLPESLAWHLESLFARLAVLVAASFRVIGPVWTTPIWIRVTRAGRRLAGLLARAPATPRPRAPGAARSRPGKPPIRLPAARGFLLVLLKHEAAHFTQRLDSLLADPVAVADLLARPAALRALRPFCRLLGVTLPEPLRPPRRPRRARPGLASPPGMLPSAPRIGRTLACPPPAPSPGRPVPPEGCWCSNPAAGPYWPFPRRPASAAARASPPPGACPQPA